ncbi:LytTR family transcriptional regulator DNA-binding domain-containing protein [Mediterraneibacter massiliensis]|nr:LytTR family transcriptional regulator DNA-binding domain-containing protein [Mediterraneibacter massiliensis]
MDKDKVWMKVWTEDIYYIQTLKSTHYCEVITKTGKGKLRADITPLQKELSDEFFKTRASTLANLDLICKIDTKKRLLYFEEEICCTYTERVAKELKQRLKLRSYRK